MPRLCDLRVREIVEAPTDGRGRLYLGPSYAEGEVRVAVLEEKPEAEENGGGSSNG